MEPVIKDNKIRDVWQPRDKYLSAEIVRLSLTQPLLDDHFPALNTTEADEIPVTAANTLIDDIMEGGEDTPPNSTVHQRETVLNRPNLSVQSNDATVDFTHSENLTQSDKLNGPSKLLKINRTSEIDDASDGVKGEESLYRGKKIVLILITSTSILFFLLILACCLLKKVS